MHVYLCANVLNLVAMAIVDSQYLSQSAVFQLIV